MPRPAAGCGKTLRPAAGLGAVPRPALITFNYLPYFPARQTCCGFVPRRRWFHRPRIVVGALFPAAADSSSSPSAAMAVA